MMKSLMKMMKGEGNMEGMEEFSEMMKDLGGPDFENMMKGMTGEDGEAVVPSQQEIKDSIKMMKNLIDNDMVSPEELEQVKKEFKNNMGADIEELISAAEEQERSGDLDADGKELLELFKQVLN